MTTALIVSVFIAVLVAIKYYLSWKEAIQNALLIQHDRDLWKRKAEHFLERTRELAQEKEELVDKMYKNMVHLHPKLNPKPCPVSLTPVPQLKNTK